MSTSAVASRARSACALPLVLLLLAGCDSAADLEVRFAADLTAAQRAWQANPSPAYRLSYSVTCECGDAGGAIVTVRDGLVVAAEGPGAAFARTVDGLFEIAQQVFAEGGTGEIRLSADAPRIPVFINLNPEQQPVDGGLVLTVTGFEAD